MTTFIAVCAIIVIGIVVAVVMDRIMRTHDRTHDTQNDGGCWGCKYLDFWNDGSALCTKSIDDICIPNGFKYRDREEDVTGN